MAQILRPISNVSNNWLLSTGSSVYVLIDDVIADDSDYVYTTANGAYFTVGLAAPANIPTSDTGHIINVRGKYSGSLRTREVALYQGTTQIAVFTWSMTTSYANYTFELTEAQAANITDYSALRLRVRQTSYGAGDYIYVSQLYFEIPDVTNMGLEMGCSF